jgi:dihydrolipoamide dehydrogenase
VIECDVAVLGGGPGGYPAAIRAAQLGANVVLVEQDRVGGTCITVGCIPTKTWVQTAHALKEAHETFAKIGVTVDGAALDFPAAQSNKETIVSGLVNGITGVVKANGITVVSGRGTFTSPNTLSVEGGEEVRFKSAIVATGSRALRPPVEGIDGPLCVDSTALLEIDKVPPRIAILGGGVIGVEFASAWKSFGTDVTIVEGLKHLVPVEDENSSKLLERAFRKRGIKFNLGTFFEKAEYTADGVRVTLADGKAFEAEVLLVAIGRGPVSQGLGYEEVGVAMDRGFVLVDEYMQTNVPTISAVGDLAPTLQLAHVGFAEGILVAERLAGLKTVPIDYDGVPRVTYCQPEVASVGITEAKAKEIYGADKVVALRYNLAGNGRSKILKAAGEIKLVQVKDGAVVGVHMVGERIGEQVGEAQLIYNWEALPAEVAQLVHAHPTQNEALGEAHLALAGKPLHSHD